MKVSDPAPSRAGPEVTILMCTYNGAHFLEKQLLSIERQSYRNWRLVACDDGSTDQTREILSEFDSKTGGRCIIRPLAARVRRLF